MKVVIRTDKLSKRYGKKNKIKAVDELNLFEVYEGKTFGLLSPNGAGKMTIIHLLEINSGSRCWHPFLSRLP